MTNVWPHGIHDEREVEWSDAKGISRRPTLVTAPTDTVHTRAFVKNFASAQDECDDEVIDYVIDVATRSYERKVRRQLMLATYDYFLDCFPRGESAIEIPRPPLVDVTEFEYFDEDDALQTLATSVYAVNTTTEPGRVYLKPEQEWPTTGLTKENVIRIRFTCGVATRDLVQHDDRHAVLMLATHWLENREPVVVGDDLEPFGVPETVERIEKMRKIPEIR